ncbi:putative ribonuclease H-like domain-containing protein [Tanacetum coccineum]|uniref:Ribonuclease H-like domain-containing protein n=1 Tax=Tanacetum coccineum TaxID=301880 RepID=A0ABQ5H4D4_9ASTR
MWRLRIEQYFQVQDFALWDVIENGNSFKLVAQTTINANGTSTSLIPCPVTIEEKAQKKNDVKARSMLLMALPNEHLMTFNQYKDAKTLFAAIQTRFGGNEATKKTQKTLLKQMYENFSATCTESLDSIFNRLQKIVSQLAILGENISQEDLNLKFLRSLSSEWNTHVVVWRNKPDLDTMSFDDLYNNFKIVEQEVKGTASSSSSSQNMAFVSSPSSTNEVNTAYGVSTANTQVNPASTQVSTASTQITINGSDTAGYDKSKVECFNCHKMGYFAREYRGPRNQNNRNKNRDSSRRTVNVEKTSSKAMVSIDGAGFDWSYMADDEVPTNMALMDFSDSEVHNDKTCSKTYLKNFETLKTQLDDLRIEFNKSEFNLATYKRGLASVEEQLVFYKKNEVIFCEQLAVLKRDISYKDSELSMLKSELEKLKQEKESNQLKIEKFDNASKSLDKLIRSQIPDKSRKGVGFVSYNAVPPPPTRLFSPLKFDLSNSGLEEFQQPEFEGYGPKTSKSVSEDISNEVRESPDAPLVKELVSDDKLEKKTVFPTVAKIEFVRPKQQEKPVRKPVKYAEMYSFDHVQADCNYHQRERVVSGNNYTRVNYNYSAKKAHPSAHRNMVPRAVLMKTGLRPLNTARPVNTAHPKTTVYSARPMSHFSKSAQSTVKRPYQIRTTLTNKNFSQKINTAKGKFYTARSKTVNTARPNSTVVNDVRANQVNVVKASACWVWRPTKLNSHQQKEYQGYVDSGCSRHMTGNMSYLSDFKEFNGEYVTFGGGSKGGKITGKRTLKTGKLDFEDVYFVKELQFNLFSVSQMCDKKNSVLLKVPRKNNMYSVDMKNIVPKESLTCLVAKATLDESMLWHRRLGHVNFKTINKLVKENLVRGLPTKRFENDQTCVACLKGKQHKASSTKDETSGILKSFITEIENLVDKKVKIIRCDNGTEFKNKVMSEFCEQKGIKREFSVARTPQQNGVAERRNRTLIEAARTMLADSKLLITFWAEVVNTACKFDGKLDERFFVRYSMNSKAFRVYNIRSRKVEKNLHIRFLEDKPIIAGDGPKWLFDIDVLIKSMNYVPVIAGTNSNDFVDGSLFDSSSKNASNDEPQPSSDVGKKDDEGICKESGIADQEKPENSTQEVDMSNITTTYPVLSTPNIRIHKDHSLDHVIGDVQSGVLTRRMTKTTNEQGFISVVYEGKTHKDLHTCLFACFLPQIEAKKVIQALTDPSWIEAMQDELLQFKLQKVWTLVDLPYGKRAIGTKWVYKNKKDKRGIVVRNKARLVAQGYTQEEGIEYDEVFALVARIEAIRLFLAYASFMNFVVYQMDVKSAFLYGKIEEEVYACQPLGFEDPEFPDRVYKVEKALYGLHQALKAWYETLSTYLLENGFRRGIIDKTLFIKKVKGDILLVQIYVDDIIFGSTKKELCTEFEKLMHKKFQMSSMGELTFFLGLQVMQKEDEIFISQDKSMIGSLMYLTASRPDIMFAVCACARFQVTPKVSHLHAVKRIFRYLKGQPKLCLWYHKDSPFDLEAYSDSDYTGESLDRKSTIGGCQFLGSRLISWQCKKQTIVSNSTTEAEYVAAANCHGHVLWIQNQMLDYGYNLMNTKIFIDNESTVCIVKNQVFHLKTKHIEIRHHFNRDSYEKRLI